MNYITNHIERLPLNDSIYAGEKLPSLFHRQEGIERNSIKYNKVNKIGPNKRDKSASRYESLSNLNEPAKPWFDTQHDTLSKSRNTIYELLNAKEQISTLYDDSTFSKQREGAAAKTSKRRRSSDSTGSDSSKSICDEEVRKICLPENLTVPSLCTQISTKDIHEGLRRSSSPKKRFLSKLDQKRHKTQHVLHCEGTKKRSLPSASWLPLRLRSCERKVKIIRITPFDHRDKELQTFYGERFREEAFFRPIRAAEEG